MAALTVSVPVALHVSYSPSLGAGITIVRFFVLSLVLLGTTSGPWAARR